MITLGKIVVELQCDDSGELLVYTAVEGEIQYVTGLGMLEMAKGGLEEIVSEEEDD